MSIVLSPYLKKSEQRKWLLTLSCLWHPEKFRQFYIIIPDIILRIFLENIWIMKENVETESPLSFSYFVNYIIILEIGAILENICILKENMPITTKAHFHFHILWIYA